MLKLNRRKRRVLAVLMAAVMTAALMTSCSQGGSQPAETPTDGAAFNIWCWNTEFQERFNDYYPGVVSVAEDGSTTTLEDGTVINWVIEKESGYQDKLDEALELQANGDAEGRVDLFLVKAGSAAKYAKSDLTLDIDEIGVEADPEDQYTFTREIVTDGDGKVKGVTWQACPGVIVYRRSIAKEVLKTDDPEDVQEALKDWTNFEETAIQVDQNRYTMLSGYDDLFNAFSSNIGEPYVSDGKTLKIDERISRWFKMMKEMADDNNVKGNKRNSDAWLADMGGDSDVFAWPVTAEEFSILKENCDREAIATDDEEPETVKAVDEEEDEEDSDGSAYGDFGICQGPAYWSRGGTWIMAAKGTQNSELAASIMTHMTTDPGLLRNLAVENGDFVNSKSVVRELIESDEGDDFFDGQETFAILDAAAEGISMKNTGAWDQDINNKLRSSFRDYFEGEIELEEAEENFENGIRKLYPSIEEISWPE